MDLGLYAKTFKRFPKPVCISLVALSGVLCLLELVLIGFSLPDASNATDWCDKQQFCDDHCDCDGVCNKTFPACECAENNYEASELVDDLGTAGVPLGYLMFILLSSYKVYLLIMKVKEKHTWKKFEKKMAAVLTPIAAGGVLYEIAIEYKGGCAEYTPMKMPTLFFAVVPTLLMIGTIMYFVLLVWWNHKGALRRDDMTLREPAIALLGLSITPLTTSGVFGVWAILVGFQISGPALGAVVCLFLDCLVCLTVVTNTVDFKKLFASTQTIQKKRKDQMLEMQMMHNMAFEQRDVKSSGMKEGFDGAIIDGDALSPDSLRSKQTASLAQHLASASIKKPSFGRSGGPSKYAAGPDVGNFYQEGSTHATSDSQRMMPTAASDQETRFQNLAQQISRAGYEDSFSRSRKQEASMDSKFTHQNGSNSDEEDMGTHLTRAASSLAQNHEYFNEYQYEQEDEGDLPSVEQAKAEAIDF